MSIKLRDFAREDQLCAIEDGEYRESEEEINYDAPDQYLGESSSRRSPSIVNNGAGLEDFPRNHMDEKPFFGPRGDDGNIQVQYPSALDADEDDYYRRHESKNVRLPSGFSYPSTTQKKGEKKTFWCEICFVELNSLDTKNSHQAGVKHTKKANDIEEDFHDRLERGEITRKEYDERPGIIPIPNPEPTKKKIPVRLHDRIKETKDPVVGLDYVQEFLPVSDPEMEPHYECELCGNKGIANGMYSHIMGFKHRQKFFEKKLNQSWIHEASQTELLKLAHKHSENNENLLEKIVTRRSDEEYPWPTGKAPWSIEKGGTGVPPDAARENYGKNKAYLEVKPRIDENSLNRKAKKSPVLPSIDSLTPPEDYIEAERYVEFGEKLMSKVFSFLSKGSTMKDAEALKVLFSSVMVKMKKERGITIVEQKPYSSNGEEISPTSSAPRRDHENNSTCRRSSSSSRRSSATRKRTNYQDDSDIEEVYSSNKGRRRERDGTKKESSRSRSPSRGKDYGRRLKRGKSSSRSRSRGSDYRSVKRERSGSRNRSRR